MVTMVDHSAAEQILADARQVRLSRVMLTLFLGTFWVIGWTAGHLWLGLVVCAISVRRGWRDGTGYVSPRQPGQPSR
jgi:hypothetical protein